MELTGRLTANAEIKTLADERQFVTFTLAQNDTYKAKDGEKKKVATYFDCAYWISTKVAERLTKGTIVTLQGRIGVNVWNNMDGKAKASLTFHTQNIQFIGGGNYSATTIEEKPNHFPSPETADNLPF